MSTTYDDYAVGDRVWSLAWLGQQLEVVHKDDERQVISIATLPGAPSKVELDVFADTMFLLTKEQWDQIWWWPDRAGETYTDVFERYVELHHVGEIVAGYVYADGLAGVYSQLRPNTRPEQGMAFRIRTLDTSAGTIRVEPVTAVRADGTLATAPDPSIADDSWQAVGPAVPLRIEMRLYRWCLTYGELALSWQDFPAS